MMMKRTLCVLALTLMAANVVNAAAQEQDDWGFALEEASSYSGPSASFQGFGPVATTPLFQGFAPQPTIGRGIFQAQPFSQPFFSAPAPSPRAFGPGRFPVFQPAPSVRFF